jgi:hypothetical protein
VLGLDLTDKDNIALQAASGLVVTALGLVGEAGSCNAKGNGVAVFDALSQATALRINGAKHCDFEAPTTAFCTLPCGRQSAARAAQVRALAAAFVAWQAGADLSGREWVVSGGVGLAQWQQRGFVTVLP